MVTVPLVSGRTLRLLIAVAALVPNLALGQQPSPKRDEPTSFLVRLGYLKAEFPYRTSSACIAVFPDGRLHLEESWVHPSPEGIGRQMFEGVLSQENLESLSAILAGDELKKLRTDDKLRFGMYEGEIIRAVVPRPEGTQDFSLAGLAGSARQYPRPLPSAIGPLVQWIRATRKQIEKQNGSLLKSATPVSCWLPKTPVANLASEPPAPKHDGEAIADGKMPETAVVQDRPKTNDEPALEISTDQTKLYSNARSFVDFPAAELQEAVPELRGLKPAQSQDELASLLARVGDKTELSLRRCPT